jgi:hypothetical protein
VDAIGDRAHDFAYRWTSWGVESNMFAGFKVLKKIAEPEGLPAEITVGGNNRRPYGFHPRTPEFEHPDTLG